MEDEIPFISIDEIDPETMCSYNEAAMILGTTHNRVRMLVGEGRIRVVARVWVRKNVPKVYVSAEDVEGYRQAHKVKDTRRVRMTEAEWKKFQEVFGEDKIK
jgi:hypothetical protein